MSGSKNDVLKLENQLCFPLYAAAREVVKRYRPYLDERFKKNIDKYGEGTAEFASKAIAVYYGN